MQKKNVGGITLKKRSLASLLIVSIIAIAAVVGVIFAFQNSGRQKDVYGNTVVTVDKENVALEIELKKDETADKKFVIDQTPLSSTEITVTVSGLPDSADRSVEFYNSTNSSGVVMVEPLTPAAEASKTGINKFKITGQNGGEVKLLFAAVGGYTVEVNVSVKLTAKNMKVAPNSYFALRQGGEKLNLMSTDVLNKFVFYAHLEDNGKVFKPNDYPIEYKLKEQYPGVILHQNSIAVTEQATAIVNQNIYVQAKLPAMDRYIEIPFYVFPKADQIKIDSVDAYKAKGTPDKVWDLIENRAEYSAANFSFELNCEKTATSDYGFVVESQDEQMVRVDWGDQNTNTRTLSTVKNLGEVTVKVIAYPILKINDKEIKFSSERDKHLQINDEIRIRVRNEFYLTEEALKYDTETFNLTTDKKSINAFYYEGDSYEGSFYDTFTLNTANNKIVNIDNEVEFELEVEDLDNPDAATNKTYYRWDSAKSLYTILQIGYWSNEDNDWVMLSPDNYMTSYQNRFCFAFMQATSAEDFLADNVKLTLWIKSVHELSVGGKASCKIDLDVTSAIDRFKAENLTQFNDGETGYALVYNTKHERFEEDDSGADEIKIFGMIADNAKYKYSSKWNPDKVTNNAKDLPFNVVVETKRSQELDCHYLSCKITGKDSNAIKFYHDYPLTFTYPNGKEYTLIIRVYPTVESLSMTVVSDNKGRIYEALTQIESGYNYLRTAYVRKGHNYKFVIETPGVSVGAFATIDQINQINQTYDADGQVVSFTRTQIDQALNIEFNASTLKEGLYECIVSLHAYSDSVFADNIKDVTEFVVYMVVVEPINNVIAPTAVNLHVTDNQDETDSTEITFNLTHSVNKKIESVTNFEYVRIECAQLNNNNITLVRSAKYNTFKIKAKYLTNEAFNIGFDIYKVYDFPLFDLDGDVETENVPFVIDYIGGELVSVNVTIKNVNPNKIELVSSNIKKLNTIGDYLEPVYDQDDKIQAQDIFVKVDDKADYQKFGVTYAEWKNGKFVLAPFNNNGAFTIKNCANVSYDNEIGKIHIESMSGVTSLGAYALVVYPCDSLRFAGLGQVDGQEVELVMPDSDTYKMVALFVGPKEVVGNKIKDLVNARTHLDVNSGELNTRGSYNWVLPSQNTEDMTAVLFYTPGKDYNPSPIKANVYYLDDLYSILGWPALAKIDPVTGNKLQNITIKKWVKKVNNQSGEVVVEGYLDTLNISKNDQEHFMIDLDRPFYTVKDDDGNIVQTDYGCFYSYSNSDFDITVRFEVTARSRTMVFYVVKSIETFDIIIQSERSTGTVFSNNLGNNNAVGSVTIQRGSEVEFKDNLDVGSGWKMDDDFDASVASSVDYKGGNYNFYPYIEFTKANGDKHVFKLDALTTTVKVNVDGGVKYLNITQDEVKLDGSTRAIYDLTMRVDKKDWSPNLLTYNFLYEGEYYQLFGDNQTVSYVNMEGGKSKLEFRLSCLNADEETGMNNAPYSNMYYTYFLKIEVAVVITVADVNPFYDIYGARLIVTENLENSPFLHKKPAYAEAALNLKKGGVDNITIAHFADTNAVPTNSSALTKTGGQTDSSVIYLDESSVGGILVVYPRPYYTNITKVDLWTSQEFTQKVIIGNDLKGNPIEDTLVYKIGFTQMVFNEDEQFYQPYISSDGMYKMVSSWSKAEGYKWDGKYYFKTTIISNRQFSYRIPNGTKFEISVSMESETDTQPIVEKMTLVAKYRDAFVVIPDDSVGDYAVCTMTQTQYQALGTTATYDVAFPEDCVPNYTNFTFNGLSATAKKVETSYATIMIEGHTLSVYLKGDMTSIGATLEVRIPYKRPGDYVNPYLSIIIVPVYFELADLEVVNHYEPLQVTSDKLTELKYRASFEYDRTLLSSSLSEKMNEFNRSLQTSNLVKYNYERGVTVEFAYSYVNGLPVITKNGVNRYIRTFRVDNTVDSKPIQRVEYLAVGTAATYNFDIWDSVDMIQLDLRSANTNNTNVAKYWTKDYKVQGRNFAVTINLQNKTTDTNTDAYSKLVEAGKIVVEVYSKTNTDETLLELTIIPVYFTFNEFKLKQNPVNPLVALSTPTVLTVEAGEITCADVNDSKISKALDSFNAELLHVQNNLYNNDALTFKRVANDDGVMNFNFNTSTRAITRADASNPVTTTSYLLVSAGITYVDGIPTLNHDGMKVETYFPVRTFGHNAGDNDNLFPELEDAPQGRTRTVAQAIGTKVRYNIAVPGVNYDALLDKYEVRINGNYVWDKDFGWDAIFSYKESIVTVTLDRNTDLFNKVLTILAYDRDGKLAYVLNIVPAYYTVEQILLADHIDETPVLIRNTENWLYELNLDFVTHYSDQAFADFDLEKSRLEFMDALNDLSNSSLVSRIDDAGYITLFAGVSYPDGIPNLVNLVNAKTVVQNTYRYILIDGIPENTKAQALGQEVVYNVNRTVAEIRISVGKDGEGKDIWEVYESADYDDWYIKHGSLPKQIKVGLKENAGLIGHRIRIGIWVNSGDEDPSYILNIIPAYFTVEDFTVAGQSVEDRDIYLYNGVDPDAPDEVDFEAILSAYSKKQELNIQSYVNQFVTELQDTNNKNLIGRYYDASLVSGDLHVTIYLDYENGKPTLVDATKVNSAFVIRIDIDFTYTIYGKPAPEPELPPMPMEPRSRTEVQAVGTTASYQIDINQDFSLDVEDLTYDDEKLKERGWKVSLVNDIVTVELLADAAETLLKKDIVLNLYVNYETVFVLTIQPVLFEVVGVETIYPEQPVDLTGRDLADVRYRAVAKYNDAVTLGGEKVINFIEAFNTNLNTERNGLLEVEVDGQYLKIDIAVDYGNAGSDYRCVPTLLNVENYPLNVLESFVEFNTNVARSAVATHYQAVGTTEFYNLGAEFNNVSSVEISVDDEAVTDGSVVAEVLPYGVSYALKVVIIPEVDLIGKEVIIRISGNKDFTMSIKPVWYIVEGFEVVNHPERHLWLITSTKNNFAEKVDNLLFRVRAKYSLNGDVNFQTALRTQIDNLNTQLVQDGASYLETYTIGAKYLVVRGAVSYEGDSASFVNIDTAKPTQIVRDVFKYVRYSDQVDLSNMVRPNIPRSRIVEVVIGQDAVYTLDLPNLPYGFTNEMIALYENSDSTKADDDSALVKYVNGTNGWTVEVKGNKLHIALQANAELVKRELKVFIYSDKKHVTDAPNSFDTENVAFILTIRPVWFKVTGIALDGYADNLIKVDSLQDFMSDLSKVDGKNFVPVFEYSRDVYNQNDNGVGDMLRAEMSKFTTEFIRSSFVAKTRVRESNDIYHFQVSASVSYVPYEGTAKLTKDSATRIWKSFKVVVSNSNSAEQIIRAESQAIGTQKTYFIDDTVLGGITGYIVTWKENGETRNVEVSLNESVNNTPVEINVEGNYVTVQLKETVAVNNPVNIVIDNFVLEITPVYYEILGFETVEHPERAVWVISPYTVKDLRYRVITTEIAESLSDDLLVEVQNSIENLNLSLNSGSAPVSIVQDKSENIVISAAVNYVNGFPQIVEMTKDKRNVVESIIPYRIWSANIKPRPEQPTVVGSTQANQIIGSTKQYTLKNIRGQVFYQYLWVENAGDLVSSFENSINGTVESYEGVTILVDMTKGALQVQLAQKTKYLENTIRIYIPYLTSVNGKEVWYSYCIEINPLLFELKGWTIEAENDTAASTKLIKNDKNEDHLLLTIYSDQVTSIRYVAKIKTIETSDADLEKLIKSEKAKLEATVNNPENPAQFISTSVDSINISFKDLTLFRNVAENTTSTNFVTLSSFIVYENGLPKLVEKSNIMVTNQISVSTGYSKDEWNDIIADKLLSAGIANAVQVIGSNATYMVEIPDAAKVFVDQIKIVDQTQKPIKIAGEQPNLVSVECEVSEENPAIVTLNVDLAAVVALRNYVVEIQIPYTEDADAETPSYVYSYKITPALYVIDGFYLETAENNYLELENVDIPLQLRAKVTYAEDVNVRNLVNLLLQDFELSLNNAVRNGKIEFTTENVYGGNNVRLESFGGNVWIQKITNKDKDSLDKIKSEVEIGYLYGVPQLGSVNPLTDDIVNITIQASTKNSQASGFPGWDVSYVRDIGSDHLQSIGTSRNYPINVEGSNITLYYEYIEVFDGGLKKGENEYEFFDIEIVHSGRQNLVLGFTLRSSARILNNWIDVRIPYTQEIDGKTVWCYYSLKIKPVLFEITAWKVKVNGELTDTVVLNDSTVELYFSPEIISGPLDQIHYNLNDLNYIKNAIKLLEKEINIYDPRISDGYTYMVINNEAQPGHEVNYSIYRDNSTDTSYFIRETDKASTTIMQLSANIAYGVSDFSKEFVDGAQAVTPYANMEGAQRINGQISIHTTDKSVADSSNSRPTVFITQENASRLLNLSSDVDYVLMSDIYLRNIPELDNGRWKPVDFPSNATLDGNNYKIYFDETGFDLSEVPTNIGLFTIIPADSVIKNLQIVLEHGEDNPYTPDVNEGITILEANLEDYTAATVNVGLLAGVNNGIITNCAILSEWQFNMRNLTNIVNPVTGEKFKTDLPFNKDGYLFDDKYFYGLNENHTEIANVYNEFGYGITKNEVTGVWTIEYDEWQNVKNWITPDRTVVANYDYSPIMDKFNNQNNDQFFEIDHVSAAKFYVYANNKELSVTLGGLVGTNAHVVTNSRVLIDVELYGPKDSVNTINPDEINVLESIVGGVAGVNLENSTITTSYFRDGSVINNSMSAKQKEYDDQKQYDKFGALLGGFVGQNNGIIQQSYAMGRSTNLDPSNHFSTAGAVRTIRNSLGGFAHINNGTIIDCLVDMVIYKTGTKGAAGGFVCLNEAKGTITNCIENNYIIKQSSGTYDFYSPIVHINKNTSNNALYNLIYAGSAESVDLNNNINAILASMNAKWLSNNSTGTNKYDYIENYAGFSMGKENHEVLADNTIWEMTALGPKLRAANDIAISHRKYTWSSSPYLYNPGTEKNPYLIWTEGQFNDYVYGATPQATESDKNAANNRLTDIEKNRQSNHLRLIDNVNLNGIKDTYKVIYTGTFEGNGLTMSGISLDAVTNDLATFGLFGKTEYATIRNINFEVGNINSTARYVGGIAGIAINTSFVDVKVNSSDINAVIKGANLVGGFVGLNVVNDPKVENYNLYSSVSVTANFHNQQTDIGAKAFGSGKEYVQQTLYAEVRGDGQAQTVGYEQGFGTAGAVFGFITSNPNNYRILKEDGTETIHTRKFVREIILQSNGTVYYKKTHTSTNENADWFLKDRMGKVIDGDNVYFRNQIILRNVSGDVNNISANVAGGLIGIMDETIELHKPNLISLNSLTGKYYLGGIVGINLGKIAGDEGYSTANLGSAWSVLSSADPVYIFRDEKSDESANKVWGMSVGAIAGYNDGFADNLNSGVIENIKVNVDVLRSSSKYQYIIGGIVGTNGNNGLISDAINTNENITSDAIRVSETHVKNFGYYFGKTVGYSSATTSAFTGIKTTRMNVIQLAVIDLIDNDINKTLTAEQKKIYCVDINNFSTTNYVGEIYNPFSIIENGTLKIQTMTLDEYLSYLLKFPNNTNFATRVEKLEPWLRSLPTVISSYYNAEGKLVFVELFEENAKKDLLDWVINNDYFDVWDINHKALASQKDAEGKIITEGKALANYRSYIEFSAISEKTILEDHENSFIKNINNYRQQRFENMFELAKYQYENSRGIADRSNADLTWNQYEKYLLLKKFATSNDVATGSDAYNYLKRVYGEIFADMVYPYGLFAEFGYQKDENNNLTSELAKVIINNNTIFCQLLQEFAKDKDGKLTFTNKDPLQVYVSYITKSNAEENPFVIGNVKMELAQYYYYMANIYGQKYEYKHNNQTYSYSVPLNFTAIKGNINENYLAYLQLSIALSQNTEELLTIPEYIFMSQNDLKYVIEHETIWVKTGHTAGGGARISSIGATELRWVEPSDLLSIQDEIKESDGIISYEKDNIVYSWDAGTEYVNAQNNKDLDITQYKEIIGLGGSLYELLRSDLSVESYIFGLKAEQYNWTDEQSEFIKNYYKADSSYDMQYALSATTYGNVLASAMNGNVRAVYQSSTQVVHNNEWFVDNNGDGDANNDGNIDQERGDPKGVWYFPSTNNAGTTFINGDKQTYYFVKQDALYLNERDGQGAALYIDADGNKLFGTINAIDGATGTVETRSAGKDTLLMYQVDTEAEADFYREEDGKKVYYKIARKVVEDSNRVVTSKVKDATGNNSDYLEEALWWWNQGFTALEFDQIKAHAMTKSVPEAGRIGGNYAVRPMGYTLADDWYCDSANTGYKGFKEAEFTTAEYVEIVLGARYQDEIWYSTFADYLLFVKLNSASTKNEEVEMSFKDRLPETSKFKNPFPLDRNGKDTSKDFIDKLATENDLADAIEFTSDRTAFLELFRAQHTTADYIAWTKYDYNYEVKVNEEDDNLQLKYFRINHYIYYVKEKVDEKTGPKGETFEPLDFKWVLDQSIRNDIFYEGVTQEARTTDLVEYRLNWFNKGGKPFMTYRDYCEWINIYAYSETYRSERGDLPDVEIDGIQTPGGDASQSPSMGEDKPKSTDGWLTIDAFAVWKRMEKYENNVEYLAKIGGGSNSNGSGVSANQTPIVAPILKRQISTTVFPKIQSSGEREADKTTGIVTGAKYVLPKLIGASDNTLNNPYVKYYGWDALGDDYNSYKMDLDHQRHYRDRYEYNERYNDEDWTIHRGDVVQDGDFDYVYENAQTYINDPKFAKACDHECGGKSGGLDKPEKCTNPTHAAYHIRQWDERYGLWKWYASLENGNTDLGSAFYQLRLDEKSFDKKIVETIYATGLVQNVAIAKVVVTQPSSRYTQLYIPYDYFKQACRQIKSVYSASNNYAGYFNYMKFWAKNGDFDWICDFSEHNSPAKDVYTVSKTYLETAYWNNYDGKSLPLLKNDADKFLEEYKRKNNNQDYTIVWKSETTKKA